MRRLSLVFAALALLLGGARTATAQAVREGFVNVPMPRGDDNYRPADYGFEINYHGFISDAGEVCTNGYIILNFFAPSTDNCAFPGATSTAPSTPNLAGLRTFYGNVLAPFYSDLNTNFAGNPGGAIQLGNGLVDGNLAWAATWEQVRGYPGGTGPLGNYVYFQAVLISLNTLGDFTMEFNYNNLAWAAEGGIGFTSDDPNQVFSLANTRPTNGRLSCDFIGGSTQACTFTTITPEPASIVLLGSGLLGIFGLGQYRRRRAMRAA
jgi:hypothetical protein